MDKKRIIKKGVIKRPNDEAMEVEKKKTIRTKEVRAEGEGVVQVVAAPVDGQAVHSAQLVESATLEQPVFVNMKGEPVQLGPNTVIVYEQSGNPSNYSFGGMWTVDSAGRIVMAETIYDVKGEPEEEGAYVQAAEITPVEEQTTYQQYELASDSTVNQQHEYEVAIVEQAEGASEQTDPLNQVVVVTTEEQLAALGQQATRWLNQKYDFVVRKLQLTYDAGVKLLHSPSGCMQCLYFTTPSMQLAFNAVPQFLCIESGIEFTSTIPSFGGNSPAQLKHTVTLFLAEDGNGKSVVVSAGISTLLDDPTWLLDTFKSCNPAWRQVRCVVADPTKCPNVLRSAFPSAHVTCSVWQASRASARAVKAVAAREGLSLCDGDLAAKCKSYALASLRGEHNTSQLTSMKRCIIGSGAVGYQRVWDAATRPGGALGKLDAWLEPDNYTNILHKGLERLVGKFSGVVTESMQPDEFVTCFFSVANALEEERRNFALSRLRDTENLKQSPTDTITQYAYNLMSHQTSLAQKCLDDRAGRKNSSAAICKYGTSTQECSCLFSKVFRLPCRHILMLTTELKVKTHIPFEPRWTVQHCLFGCDNNQPTVQTTQAGNHYVEQVLVDDSQHRQTISQPQQIHQVGGVRQQQYVLAAPGQTTQPVSQVIFCNSGVSGVGQAPVITSVLPAGGAVLTPHHALHHA